jgi:hypothetical protein
LAQAYIWRIFMKKFLMFGLVIISAGAVFFASTRVVPLPGLMKPQTIMVDNSQLFITEGTTIYIYSLKDFKLQAKFGQEGEGPGEFKDIGFGVKLEPTADKLTVYSPGRISYFSREGKFIKEQQITDPRKGQFKKLGDRFVGTAMKREKSKVYFVLNLYDSQLKVMKELYTYEHPFYPQTKRINPLNVRVCSYYVYGKRIYVDDSEGNINIYDDEGKKISMIKPPYETLRVTEEAKKHCIDLWKNSLREEYNALNTRFRFPSLFPPLRNFHVLDNKIYIITYQQREGKSKMYIYSLEGKLLKTSYVPLADVDMLLPNLYNYYTIKGEKLYKLVENIDSENWELHISPIE